MFKIHFPHYIDDFRRVDRTFLQQKIDTNTQFSFSYIVLLVCSTVICTLGLLLNSTAIIIGGMIIAPLMWPIMKISVGVAYGKKNFVYHALFIFFLSLILGLCTSFIITFISPIKLINDEILARTTPTLLDIIVALAAGAVATLAVSHEKVADDFAGVAIAVSLMPPLCVAGIGLAVFNIPVFFGGFLLFIANVVSIAFISILGFIFIGIRRADEPDFRLEGLTLITVVLIVTAIPLFLFLKDYSFRATAYQRTVAVLSENLTGISPGIYIQNVTTRLTGTGDERKLQVEADVLVPEGLVIDYQHQRNIVSELERSVNSKIDLDLRLQNVLSFASEEDKIKRETRDMLMQGFQDEIMNIEPSFAVNSLSVVRSDDGGRWNIEAVLRGDPSIQFTEAQRRTVEQALSERIGQPVELDIDILSRIQLKSQPDIEVSRIKKDMGRLLTEAFPDISISSVVVKDLVLENGEKAEKKDVQIVVDIVAPNGFVLGEDIIQGIQKYLYEQYQKTFSLQMNVVYKTMLLY